MPRSYTIGQLHALIALFGGIDAAADELDISPDDLESILNNDRRLTDDTKDDFDNDFRKWKRRHREHAAAIDRAGDVLEWYPELLEIIDNDGLAAALVQYPKFADIFYKDPTKWQDESGKWYSDGGLYPGAIKAIIHYATHTQKGGRRKRGQVDLSPMIDALIKDDFEIGYIDDSAFWEWFRDFISP